MKIEQQSVHTYMLNIADMKRGRIFGGEKFHKKKIILNIHYKFLTNICPTACVSERLHVLHVLESNNTQSLPV